jgi:hypothetical protein
MSKRKLWSLALSLVVLGFLYVGLDAYINRTSHCFEIAPEKWNQACADHAETLALQGNEQAMGGLALAYPNLNNRDRGYFWRLALAERGNIGSLYSSAYLCEKHASLTRQKVLELINRHVTDQTQKVELIKILDNTCPHSS